MTTLGFALSLVGTVVLLVATAYTGWKARRRLHLCLVAATLAALGLTIFLAVRLGKLYDLEAAGWVYPVHRWLARTATFSFALPLATGLATLRNPRMRRWHRRAALTAGGLTVLATVTGLSMLLLATPK